MKKYNKKRNLNIRVLAGAILLVCLIVFLFFRTASTANAGTENSVRYKYYTSIQIENGSSLWDIAQEYMSEEYPSAEEYIQEIKQINHIDGDLIYAGSYLCIPYYSSELK